MTVDTVIKIAAIAGFAVSVAVLAYYVPEWNLVAVLAIAVGMAIYDFFLRPRHRRNARNRGSDNGDAPEER